MSLVIQDMMPGMGADNLTGEREFVWGTVNSWHVIGIKINKDSTDAGNTPTTILRRGLIMGKVASTGEYKPYSASATDGSQIPVGVLYQDTNMLDNSGTAVAKNGRLLIAGMLKVLQLIGFDEIVRRYFNGRFILDDVIYGSGQNFPLVQAKTADYTVTAADNNTHFTNAGAAGAVNFTLPTCAVGLRYRFTVEANQTLTITAASGKLVAYNNAAATSIAFSTANEKVGGSVEIVANADGSKWLSIVQLGFESQTIVIA